jgi:hypothetical protein
MTDEAIVVIARSLAAALAQAGYSRNPNDKREVARLQTELCAAVRQEEQGAKSDVMVDQTENPTQAAE